MHICQCNDPGCPAHIGRDACDRDATENLKRIDQDDETGTDMCQVCAEDALDSGLFATDDTDGAELDFNDDTHAEDCQHEYV